jgi:hypothetical protein
MHSLLNSLESKRMPQRPESTLSEESWTRSRSLTGNADYWDNQHSLIDKVPEGRATGG